MWIYFKWLKKHKGCLICGNYEAHHAVGYTVHKWVLQKPWLTNLAVFLVLELKTNFFLTLQVLIVYHLVFV